MVFVVERYLPGLSRTELLQGLSRLEQASGGESAEVRYLGSTIVLEDEACFCQFDGPSAAAVAAANRQAGLSFDRIVHAVEVLPERSTPLTLPTTIPATIQIRRSRLLGFVAAVVAATAVVTWSLVSYAFESSPAQPSAVDQAQVRQAAYGLGRMAEAMQQGVQEQASLQTAYGLGRMAQAMQAGLQGDAYIRAITSMTPAQLIATFGTDAQVAAVLASLTPKEREHVVSIMALTPKQLTAAFGTGFLASLTPAERSHVESILALTPKQLAAAFGTSLPGSTASVLAGLTPKERRYVRAITGLTPAQLAAAFGTSGR